MLYNILQFLRIKRREWIVYIGLFVATMLLEVFIFNFSAIRSIKNEPQDITNKFAITDGAAYNPETGKLLTTELGTVILEATELDADIQNLYLNISFDKSLVTYEISVTDEGNCMPYEMPLRVLMNFFEDSKYVSLHTYGNVHSIKLTFWGDVGTDLTIGSIEMNAIKPINIRWIRVACIYMIFVLLSFARRSSFVHKVMFDAKDRKQLLLGMVVCAICIGMTYLAWSTNVEHWRENNKQSYYDLTKSLSQGQVYLDYEVDPKLLDMENPYDAGARLSNDVSDEWDVAFFDGKYYCYFGIVPVILVYLPIYSLTGNMPHNVNVMLLFSVLMVIGCFWCIYQMIKRYCTNIPFYIWPALAVILGFSENFFYLYMRPDFYNIPVLLANVLTVWGLGFWMKGTYEKGVKWIWYVAGSLCMSLVAGCRPQMLLLSVLALPLFWEELIYKRELFSKKGYKDTIALCSPYIIVGIGLMYYNYVRFGSVTEFGALYNLTTNDMTRRGFNVDRLWGGIFALLFQPPVLSGTFPYLREAVFSSKYMGKTIVEFVFGGVFATNIITWINVSVIYIGNLLKKYKVRALVLTSLGVAIVIGGMDATVAGILQRYTADITLAALIPSCIVALVLVDYTVANHNYVYNLLSGALLITMLITMMFDFFLVFVQTGVYNVHKTNQELFYLIESYFLI